LKKEAIDSALYAKMNPSFPELKIYFVADLKYVSKGICLYWINEVHIDETVKSDPLLEDILRHEVRHYAIITKALRQSSELKKGLLLLYNNIWNFFDCLRITLKRAKIILKDKLGIDRLIYFPEYDGNKE